MVPAGEAPPDIYGFNDTIAEMVQWHQITLPVYVGVGLRATADIQSTNGKLEATGLGAIGIEAEAGKVSGTLVLQSIGVNSEKIAAQIPIQSELNRTTTQNAIVAIAAIKPLIADEESTVTPRVLGMYVPMPADLKLINAIVSVLATRPIIWSPPTDEHECDHPSS